MTEMLIETTDFAGLVVATPAGRLDLASYPSLRDGLLKHAANEPLGLVVRLGPDFEVASTAMYAVFSTVWMKISPWPDIPLVLLAESETHRHELDQSGVSRFVPTCTDLAAAIQVSQGPPPRRFRRVGLPNSPTAPLLARSAVREACALWHLPGLADDAVLVVSELVENAVRHAHSKSSLRIELRRDGLSLAVRDDAPEPATLVPALPLVPGHRGMELIDKICAAWGSTPSTDGGKIVWAVLSVRGGE
ncbi:ATP-binding protein [Lentzea sp. PSKA42]|jgi:hypothetical protein|uniref:ATP-binding protein n=2 Tax=Lentzea indica TaxID=2604800 RepID=A0ABX1FPR3_9PSEU|nr:ATP-binding protein [Lentzea indica]